MNPTMDRCIERLGMVIDAINAAKDIESDEDFSMQLIVAADVPVLIKEIERLQKIELAAFELMAALASTNSPFEEVETTPIKRKREKLSRLLGIDESVEAAVARSGEGVV